MWRRKSPGSWYVQAVLVAVLLAPVVTVASHFRGGTMSATIDANGVVTVTAETLWRKNAAQGAPCVDNAGCRRCFGGSNPGAVCLTNAQCFGGGACQGNLACVGGICQGEFGVFPVGGINRNALIEGFFPSSIQILDATRTVLRDSLLLPFGPPSPPPPYVAAPPGDDSCGSATPISGVGTFDFSNIGATTDGVPDPVCDLFGFDDIPQDVWFCWTADFSGPVTVSTCDLGGGDTKVAIYDGCACPAGSGILDCDEDTCAAYESTVSTTVVSGQSYLIRIGNFFPAPQFGQFSITQGTGLAPLSAIDIVGTTVSVDFSDPAFDLRRQEFTLDLPSMGLGPGRYIIYWVDAGRIPGIYNVTGDIFGNPTSQSAFSLEACILYDGSPHETPRINSRVITTVAQGQLYSNNLNASGDSALTYTFLSGSGAPRYAWTDPIPGIAVSSIGQVEIPPVDTATLNEFNYAGQPAGEYVFKVEIRDQNDLYVEQDVLLDVITTPNQLCAITASETNPVVSVGQTLVLTLEASDPDPLNTLTITDFPTVANSMLTQTGTTTNPATASATYEFTPTLDQAGSTIGVNFGAFDDDANPLTCIVNVQITVPLNQPPDCDAGGPYTTECAGSTTSVQLDGTGSSDPDVGDTLSYAWTTDCPGGTFDDAGSATPTLTVDSSSLCPTPCNVMLTVTDDFDASDPCSTTVTVEDTGSPGVMLTGNPLLVPVNSSVSFSAAFTDDCGDPHDASWNFGDGSLPLAQSGVTSPAGAGHAYTTQGIYVVTVTITDDCGNAGSDSLVVVVYNPADGFTMGGGWLIPDSGSFINNIGVTDTVSKANFGFIVKYHQGATNPNGNLEFQYKAGDINLKSSGMEWMVVTSTTKVRFKGQATINGSGLYTFKVTGEDLGEPGAGTDTFKIEIWTGVVDTENGPPTPKHLAKGVLGGGNIQIHH